MRHLLEPVQCPDMIQSVNAGTEASVQAEDLSVHEGRERQVVKQVGEVFPDVSVAIFPEAFVVETVDLGDLAGFVVATEDRDTLAETNLEQTTKKREKLIIFGRGASCRKREINLEGFYFLKERKKKRVFWTGCALPEP